MVNVSEAFKQALQNDQRNYLEFADITLADDTVLHLTNENIWQNGFSIEDSVGNDETFSALGSTIINSCTLVINNIYDDFTSYDFTDAIVVMQVGLELPLPNNEQGTYVEKVEKGTFTVDEAQYNGSIITLKCMDYMAKFDKPYSESTLIYPATLGEIVRDACKVCLGSESKLATQQFPRYNSYIVTDAPVDEDLTFREAIGWCATIAGCFARCNTDGELEIKWFPQSELTTRTSASHSINSLYSQNISVDDIVITGVRVTAKTNIDDSQEETESRLEGTEGYVVDVKDNDFIGGSYTMVASWLGAQLNGLAFRKADISHSSDPTIEAGDVAYITDRKNNVYPILITRTVFAIGSSQKTICGADTPSRNSATRYSQATKSYVENRKQIRQQKTALDELREEVENAAGMYETQETVSGATITYLHDKPLLEDSSAVIKISSVGVTVTPDYQADPITWYGLTVDGNLISNILTTIGINAEWINSGNLLLDGSVNKNMRLLLKDQYNVKTGEWQSDHFEARFYETDPDDVSHSIKAVYKNGDTYEYLPLNGQFRKVTNSIYNLLFSRFMVTGTDQDGYAILYEEEDGFHNISNYGEYSKHINDWGYTKVIKCQDSSNLSAGDVGFYSTFYSSNETWDISNWSVGHYNGDTFTQLGYIGYNGNNWVVDGEKFETKWKRAGQTTGQSTVTIPDSNAEEVCVTVKLGDTTMTTTAIISTLNSRLEVGGYYISTSDYGLCNLNVSNNGLTYQIRNARYGGQDYKSVAALIVYYR